jgi:hypothetical protein
MFFFFNILFDMNIDYYIFIGHLNFIINSFYYTYISNLFHFFKLILNCTRNTAQGHQLLIQIDVKEIQIFRTL